MKQNNAVPDVDLKSRGVPNQALLVGLAVVGFFFFYSRRSAASGEQDELSGEVGEDEARWVSWLLWLALRFVQLLLGFALLILVILVVQQRKILYIPAPPNTERRTKDNPSPHHSPGADRWSMPFEDVMITTADGTKINAWLIYQPLSMCDEVPFTFIYFHGNAGNIGHRLDNIHDMHKKLRVNVLIVDYRAYGDSEDGDGPSQRGFLMDAHAAYRWLVERINSSSAKPVTKMSQDRILIFGRSIGGAVGIHLFADLVRLHQEAGVGDPALPLPAGIILENTFTSLSDMAVQVFPFLSVVSFLLRAPLIFDEWKSNEKLKYICKHHEQWCCCLLSGMEDQLVPPAQMVQLHSILKTRQPKVLKFFRFRYGGHNDTPVRGGAEYWHSFAAFMSLVKESEANRLENMTPAGKQKGT